MKKTMKKIAGLVIATVLTVSCVALTTGCSPEQIKKLPQSMLSFSQIYDYSALGGINLLNASVGTENVTNPMNAPVADGAPVSNENKSEGNSATLSEEEKEEILMNLEIARGMINGGVVKSEVTASSREGYAFMYTLTAKDVDGTDTTYVFYYNSTEKVDKDDADEKEILMEGIVVVGEDEYTMRGEQSFEEGETEVEFKVMIDENNYVVIEQETSEDEQEYKYTMYNGGKKVFSTSVEYEVEDGETELKFKTKTADGNEVVYKYEFYSNEKGSFVEIKTKNLSFKTKVIIAITEGADGETVYEFVSTKSEEEEKAQPEFDDDDKDDEDDDD